MSRTTWSLFACVGWGMTWIGVGLTLLVEMTTCTQGDTDSWLASLVVGVPLMLVALVVLALARRRAGATRWLALPHALLLPPTLLLVAHYFSLSTLHGIPLCDIATGNEGFGSSPQDWWNRWWAPLQGAVLIALAAMIYAYWHQGRGVDDRRQ